MLGLGISSTPGRTGRENIYDAVGGCTAVASCVHGIVGDLYIRVVVISDINSVTYFEDNGDGEPGKCQPTALRVQGRLGAATAYLFIETSQLSGSFMMLWTDLRASVTCNWYHCRTFVLLKVVCSSLRCICQRGPKGRKVSVFPQPMLASG